MKQIILIVFDLTIYFLVSAQVQPTTYTCPMHPEIHATKPGNCPKCGMKLIKEKPKAVAKPVVKKPVEMKMPGDTTKPKSISNKDSMQMQPVTYTCPMHPEIHADKPGNCPKCGMKLIKEQPKVGNPSDNKKEEMKMPGDTTKHQHNMDNMEMNKPKTEPIKTIVNNTPPRIVRYDLYITDTIVNFTGKAKHAIAVNGQIPDRKSVV